MPKKLYRIALLDGTLPGDGTVARLEKQLLSTLLVAYRKKEWEIEVERKFVRSQRSLERTLAMLRDRRQKSATGIHFVGHGCIEGSAANIQVGNEMIDLGDPDNLRLFEGLGARWILLSCCDIGGDAKTLRALRRVSGCDAVFAYEGIVYDYQVFLVDSMFYHLLLVNTPRGISESSMTWSLIRRRLNYAANKLLTGAHVRASYL